MNQRQTAFCDAYIKTGNATEAAKEAGYSQKTARSIGQRLLTNVDIQQYIQQRNDEINEANIAEINEIRRFWTEIMRDEASKSADRIKVSELLAKTYGAFLYKFSVTSQDDVHIYIPDNMREAVRELSLDDAKATLEALRNQEEKEL